MHRRSFISSLGGAALLGLTGCGGDTVDENPGAAGLARVQANAEPIVHADDGTRYTWHTAARRIQASTASGLPLWTYDATEGPDALRRPVGLAAQNGRLYVADPGRSHILVLDERGAPAGTLSVPETEHGSPSAARAIVAGPDSCLYVCSPLGHRIWRIDPATGVADTYADALNFPEHAAFDRQGDLHVVESGERCVVVLDPRGREIRRYGGYGDSPGRMLNPEAIAVDRQGNCYVSDAAMTALHSFDAHGGFIARQAVRDAGGAIIVPHELSWTPDGTLLVAGQPDPSAGLLFRQYQPT